MAPVHGMPVLSSSRGNVGSVLAEPFAGLLGDALTAEVEAELAARTVTEPPAHDNLVPPTGETAEAATNGDGFTDQAVHIQNSAVVEGLDMKRLVGATTQRSNHPAAADALLKLAATLDA